ncbi:MAG: hypothetical protein MHPSP_003335, partial [Paramarteilia canceri]
MNISSDLCSNNLYNFKTDTTDNDNSKVQLEHQHNKNTEQSNQDNLKKSKKILMTENLVKNKASLKNLNLDISKVDSFEDDKNLFFKEFYFTQKNTKYWGKIAQLKNKEISKSDNLLNNHPEMELFLNLDDNKIQTNENGSKDSLEDSLNFS